MMDSIPSGTIRLQIPDFLSDGNSNVHFFRAFTCQNSKLENLTLKMYGKVTEYNIRNDPVRWQISTCKNFRLEQFSRALTVFEILTFERVDLEKVGQGHGVQHWQCRSQIANVKIYKRRFLDF